MISDQQRITADKREIKGFPKLPSATSFIRKTLGEINATAFMSTRDGKWEIYVMNADASGQTNLTNSLGYDR